MKNVFTAVLAGVVLLLGVAVFGVATRPVHVTVDVQGGQPAGNAGPDTASPQVCQNGKCNWVQPITCNAASSTLFSYLNPFSSTSTARVTLFQGTGNASSSVLTIGTSTARTGLSAVGSASLVPSVTVATATTFALSSGVTQGGAGWLSTTGAFEVGVGPSQFVSGYATGSFAVPYTPGFTSCTGFVEFTK